MRRLATVLCLAAIVGHLSVANAEVDEACIPSEGAQLAAGNFLILESKTVGTGKPVTVGLAITNEVAVRNIIIPLIIREVDAGAFIGALTPQRTPGGRLSSVLTGISVINTYTNEDGVKCKGSQPGGFATIGPTNGISPDGVTFSLGKLFPGDPPLQAGTDGYFPSLQILMTANNTPGQFEIDTSCCDPGCHVVYVDNITNQGLVPAFTKGVVTIVSCDCPNQGDVNGDGVLDLFDVLIVLDYQFSGGPQPPIDPGCPAVDRGDVNCDGYNSYLFDAIYLINHIFINGPPPCNPCDCANYPTNCP